MRVRVERVCMRQICIGNRRVCQAQSARGTGVSIAEACMRVEGRGVALELLWSAGSLPRCTPPVKRRLSLRDVCRKVGAVRLLELLERERARARCSSCMHTRRDAALELLELLGARSRFTASEA